MQGGPNSVYNGFVGSGSNASGNAKDARHESEVHDFLGLSQIIQACRPFT